MISLSSTTLSEFRPAELHFQELLETKAFYQQIYNNNDIPQSYHWFCKLFYNIINNTSINDHTLSILNRYTKPYELNNKAYTISIGNKIPIMQFITDIYFQCVFQNNLTINQFMENSKFLSSIPYKSRPWQIIRRHLSDYLKLHQPINTQLINHTNEEGIIRHNTNRILYYLTHIHQNLSALSHLRQIDIVFITHKLSNITDQYFDDLGIEYQRLCTSGYDELRSTTIWSMLRRFNDSLHKKLPNKRCIILIMTDSDDVNNDTVYILEPLQHNTLPSDLINCTEIPFIINSKNDYILPDLSLKKHDALSLSIHRHMNKDIERVYIQYRSYGMRVFKHNLKDILTPFCSTEPTITSLLKWEDEIKHREFKDAEYLAFIMTYFNDFSLISKPEISYYFEGRRCFMKLYEYMISEPMSDYMYSPTAYEQYVHINGLINTYYEDMDDFKDKNDAFITFIHENEFYDCSVDEMLGINATTDACVISCFDDTFPVVCPVFDEDIEEYIFYLLQHCYIYGRLPTREYMLSKMSDK